MFDKGWAIIYGILFLNNDFASIFTGGELQDAAYFLGVARPTLVFSDVAPHFDLLLPVA
ncbi:MAG: hypothetical protein GQF41_0212 [Candidatus Rifleibacterium amylolyticum]|nr:MAG: hypothetical protein GQF41_0212 [Candidatus Rifleibacterium amylolyticum]